jgi:hypothetical protein
VSEHRVPAFAFFVVIALVLFESLSRCMLPPTYSEYGEAPDYRD